MASLFNTFHKWIIPVIVMVQFEIRQRSLRTPFFCFKNELIINTHANILIHTSISKMVILPLRAITTACELVSEYSRV